MILLNRIYSETKLFDEVEFRTGINIILGKYSRNREGRGPNGVGKSTLIRLIDFSFLSNESKGFFDINKYSFLKEHSVTLEFNIDNDFYIIKRDFSSPSIAYFGVKERSLVEYDEVELRQILGTKFFRIDDYDGYIDGSWFRSLMRFFIKDDINRHYRKDPLNFIDPHLRESALLFYNLYLLGIPNKNAYEFDVIQGKIRKLKGTKKGLENKIEEDTGKTVIEYRTEILDLEEKVRFHQESLKKFRFLDNYKNIEERLIELSDLISQKLKFYNALKRKLDEYQKSYELNLEVNLEQIKRLYSSINNDLSHFVKQTLDDVISFRREIADNRKKFLMKRETELNSAINNILDDISALEEERSKLYKLLQEKEALDSIMNTYEQLINEKTKIERNTSSIRNIQEIEKSIADLEIEKSRTISYMMDDISKSRETIEKLISLFNDILRKAILLDEPSIRGYFNIEASSKRTLPVNVLINVPMHNALGQERFKILAYDLMVFFNIIETRPDSPYFLIHDGVFHSIVKKTVINVLNYVYSMYLRYPKFQYITTMNEDEVLVHPDDRIGDYRFDWRQMVIAEYEDIPEKKIFKRQFS